MKMIIFALLVLVAVLVLLLLRKYTRLEFVGHASLLLKTWSVKLGAIGALADRNEYARPRHCCK
ncbi:hypothetical protein LXL84_15535 [Klebsiella pneumoniae]|uniref:hypothetical protein n=1 Tax=Klebsiella pneumoniae TaxID=573 RepID=UPI002113D69E|nr:hypothetical protein [Klebsiella pneumoniae]UUE33952.1 hypothetical protein LXL84_15535 [Klebsiella pneumoniae]